MVQTVSAVSVVRSPLMAVLPGIMLRLHHTVSASGRYGKSGADGGLPLAIRLLELGEIVGRRSLSPAVRWRRAPHLARSL
jgi:hypothetical protein